MPNEYKITKIASSDIYFDNKQSDVMTSPKGWLETIYRSAAIITDSFHCCVFSIIFQRPFLVILNAVRGNSRLESLLTTFEMQDRFLHHPAELETKSYLLSGYSQQEMNMINNTLSFHRNKGASFLRQALG